MKPSLVRGVAVVVAALSIARGTGHMAQAKEAAMTEQTPQDRSLLSRGDEGPLQRVLAKARRGEPIVLGMIGGSITQRFHASSQETCYASRVAAWWRSAFPQGQLKLVNAGIGATGSDYGALRVQRDLLSPGPDLVIIEFAVNDSNQQSSAQTLEGLVRQALRQPNQPAVILLFMMNSDGGNAQQWHAQVGRHYGVPMISYRDGLWPEIQAGRLKWSEISPDTVHPNDRGHEYAAGFLTHLLEQTLQALPATTAPAPRAGPRPLPPPLFTDRFEHTLLTEADALKPLANEGWGFEPAGPGRDACWKSDKPGSSLEFQVEGRLIYLMFWRIRGAMGRAQVRVDERPPQVLDAWFDQTWGGYRHLAVIAGDLAAGPHRIRIQLLEEKDPRSTGHEFRLLGVGAADVGIGR